MTRNMLDSMESDCALLDLEARIPGIERLPSELYTERALARERLGAYKYPVLTLPNEITSEIFIHFPPIYPNPPPLTGLASPTTLTHVCHQWRGVALATPALWRALKFYDNDVSDSYKLIRHISDAWIKRSGSCPLSIVIDIEDSDILREIYTETLAMAATRWEHLRLLIPWHSHPKIGRMPLLRSLDLADPSFRPRNEVFTYDAPQLRTVVLSGVVQNVHLPWAQLTSLTINNVGINRCASILRQTTNLVRCDLLLGRYSLRHEVLDFPTPDLMLPFLHSLTLKTTLRHMYVDDFLAALVVPALHRLDLEEIFLGDNPIAALEMFITKSGCQIQEVRISGKNPEHGGLYRQAFPSIPVLHLYVPERAGSREF
ncbi:hypothetical protein C8R45DRAFT_1034708 [Mycena sanguinolenta]|nr:hypothetical protein C8R45DRAFT_1034708 [Mycena sanguinolenta]